MFLLSLDLGRMYNLVARIPDGLGQLRTLLENHITNQGLNALEKCGDQAFNVSSVHVFVDLNNVLIVQANQVCEPTDHYFSFVCMLFRPTVD